MQTLYAQKYMETVCLQHIHVQHLKDSKEDKNFVGDIQHKHLFQDQILVKPFIGA